MLHIFISYAHEDGTNYRDNFIARLNENGFKNDDYWYDQRDIEAGEEWREAIDKALNEFFIVVIILTRKAVKSHYVTYEWARAISDGLKVIPIVFEALPKVLKHPLIERKQFEEWSKEGAPEKIIETIKQYQDVPPDIEYLSISIKGKILSFRVLARIVLWFYPYIETGLVDKDLFSDLLTLTEESCAIISKVLTEQLVDWSHAFVSKQRRACRLLIEELRSLYSSLSLYSELKQSSEYTNITLLEYHFRKIELLASSFGNHTNLDFEILDEYLTKPASKSNELDKAMVVIDQVFPDDKETTLAIWEAMERIKVKLGESSD